MEKLMKIWQIPSINPLRRASLRAIGVGFKPNSPKEEPGNSSAVRSLSKKGHQKWQVGKLLRCELVSCWFVWWVIEKQINKCNECRNKRVKE